MSRVNILVLSLIFFMSVFVHAVFAQITDNDSLFAIIQRQLAGDPANWSIRVPDNKNNNVFVPVRERPQDIVRREERARTTTSEFNTSSWAPGELLRKYVLFDAKMANTRALGDVIRQLTDDRFFEGNYILTTNETSELGKIKDLYGQVVAGITRFDTGRTGANNTLASCLRDSAGVCRHMATILQKSLEKAGVASQQMISPEHHWVRVTLSDPAFEGISFDLDPTWYQQAIPLAPRDNSSMSIEWSNRMLAIAVRPDVLNLNGKWVADDGGVFDIVNTAGTFAGVLAEGYPGWVGKVVFSGKLTGVTFKGTQLWRGKSDCSNLEMRTSSIGTVSADGKTITTTSIKPMYYTSTCTYAYEGEEETSTYTRQAQLSPSPKPSPKQ